VHALLGQPRRLALLAYLAAATPLGFHRRDSLLALFWPELDQEHARAALRQALHVVRDALGAGAVTSRGDEEIGLDYDQVSCDVVAFERAVDREQFREALDLYRGDLLEGFFISDAPEFERWLETERTRLREAAGRAARDLMGRAEARGNFTTAVQWPVGRRSSCRTTKRCCAASSRCSTAMATVRARSRPMRSSPRGLPADYDADPPLRRGR